MTDKFKDIIEKCLKAINSGAAVVKKAWAKLKEALAAVGKALKRAVDYLIKVTEPIRKWAKPYITRFVEFAEPKLLKALDATIKKLEEMSESYEERRIERSKLTPREKFFRYFPRVTAFTVVALGALFIIAVYHLYLTGGETPFTRERVGDYLIKLLIPSVITLVMLIANAVVSRLDKTAKKKPKENTSTAYFKQTANLEKLSRSFDFESASDDTKALITAQRSREKNARTVAIVTTVICAIYSLIVTFDTGRYTVESVNSDIAGVAFAVLSCAAITLGVWSAHTVIRASAKREEMSVIRAAIKENSALLVRREEDKRSHEKRDNIIRNITRGVIISASAVLIILGIMNGGMADVLAKAIKICTECIGLG